MSGIFGIFNRNGKPIDKKTGDTMLDAMGYWEPDDAGIWIDGSVALGHTQLWNTSESKYENLPLQKNEYVLTMDARIDNRDELAEALELPDRPMGKIGDSEFILAAYRKWGEECPKYFVGDFAFVIWDEKKQHLFCVRDHFGIKPFYYHDSAKHFIFSSNIDALFSIDDIVPEENEESILSFICYSTYAYDQTMYKDIMRLPLGSCMIVKNDKIKVWRYWKPETIKANTKVSFEEAAMKVKELFTESVKAKLRTYSNVGCELSGGVDSSAVICTASIIEPDKKITPFSLRYGNYSCDEGEYINAVTKQTGIPTVSVRGDKIDYVKSYNMEYNYRINRHWPIYITFTQSFPLVAKMKEHNLRILLTGQGGDHLFEGNMNMISDFFVSMQVKNLYRELKRFKSKRKAIMHFIIGPLLPKKYKRYIKNILIFLHIREKDTNALFTREQCMKPYDISDEYDFYSQAFKYDVVSISSNTFAMWTDSFSYRFIEDQYGIEVRHPFFDVRLVEYMLSLPPEYKMQEGVSKILLREAMKGVLPEKVRIRDDKAEFSQTILDQLEAIDLDTLFIDSVLVQKGIFTVQQLEHMKNTYHHGGNLLFFWRVVNFEYWHKKTFT